MPAVASYAPRGQATRTSRHRPQRVPVFRNDNWPPRPPAQPLPAPSFLGSPDSDTLRTLPAPSFVTPPEDIPAKPAAPSKAVIAASAVPLADWFADVVWALYLGPQSATSGGNSGLAGADKAPQPLTAFVHAVLSQTLASPQCAALGLYYLVKLPVRLGSTAVRAATPLWNVAVDAEGHTSYTSVQDRDRAARAGFVAELYGPGGEDVPYRLAALALMLGNKWLDDHTFTNKTWHEVTHLNLARLTALEQRALECFNYSLGVPNEDWRAWLGVLNEGAQGALPSCPAMSALAIHTMDRLEKELEVLTAGVGAGVVDVFAVKSDTKPDAMVKSDVAAKSEGKGVIGDRRASVSTTEMDLDDLEMQQVEIDIDLDDGGPVPDELRRPVKVRLGAGGEVVEDVWAKGRDAWEKEARGSWGKNEASWGKNTEAKGSWGKHEGSWGKEASWGRKETWGKANTWNFMDEDQDEWERAIRAAGLMDDQHDHWDLSKQVPSKHDHSNWDPQHDHSNWDPQHDHSNWDPSKRDQSNWDQPRPNPVGNEIRKSVGAKPRVELYDSRMYREYAFPDYSAFGKGYGKGYDGRYDVGKGGYDVGKGGYDVVGKGAYDVGKGIGKGGYEYPTKGVYYAPAYEAVPRDYDPGYDGAYHFGCPRQVPAWQKSSGCVLG